MTHMLKLVNLPALNMSYLLHINYTIELVLKNNENFINRKDFRYMEDQHSEMDGDIPRLQSR